MNTIKQKLLTNWHLMRIFRLGIGIWMVVLAFQTYDWAVGLFGAFFLYQAVTDTGCCGAQGCYTPKRRDSVQSIKAPDEVDYEEVK
jgi:hypothetical protein